MKEYLFIFVHLLAYVKIKIKKPKKNLKKGLDGSRKLLHPCALDKSSLSIERVKVQVVSGNAFDHVQLLGHPQCQHKAMICDRREIKHFAKQFFAEDRV